MNIEINNTCDLCQKVCKNFKGMRIHRHHCLKKQSSPQPVQQAVIIAIPVQQAVIIAKPTMCDICRKSFNTHQGMQVHRRSCLRKLQAIQAKEQAKKDFVQLNEKAIGQYMKSVLEIEVPKPSPSPTYDDLPAQFQRQDCFICLETFPKIMMHRICDNNHFTCQSCSGQLCQSGLVNHKSKCPVCRIDNLNQLSMDQGLDIDQFKVFEMQFLVRAIFLECAESLVDKQILLRYDRYIRKMIEEMDCPETVKGQYDIIIYRQAQNESLEDIADKYRLEIYNMYELIIQIDNIIKHLSMRV